MDSVPSPPSSSPRAAAAPGPCCRFDALRRACAGHAAVAARAAGWALGALLTCVFAVGTLPEPPLDQLAGKLPCHSSSIPVSGLDSIRWLVAAGSVGSFLPRETGGQWSSLNFRPFRTAGLFSCCSHPPRTLSAPPLSGPLFPGPLFPQIGNEFNLVTTNLVGCLPLPSWREVAICLPCERACSSTTSLSH